MGRIGECQVLRRNSGVDVEDALLLVKGTEF
jgi:hypothetical protein